MPTSINLFKLKPVQLTALNGMARQPRFVLPNYPQHVIQRGNNRNVIFHAPGDYYFFLEKLKLASEKHGCLIHAYILMTNHVHLLVTPLQENSISKMQQMVGRYYVQYFNKRYHRSGTLWEGRYKATLIDNEKYFLTCARYIEMNPVRAGMVQYPGDYLWSSYHYNAFGKDDALIHPHDQYLALGSTKEKRLHAYQLMYKMPIAEETIEHIRDATNKAWILGDVAFTKTITPQINRRASKLSKGGDLKSQYYKNQKDINRV